MSGEKNEKPTSKKIKDARDKAQVAVSRDLARLIMLTVLVETVFGTESLWRGQIHAVMNLSIQSISRPFATSMVEMMRVTETLVLGTIAVMALLCIIVGVCAFWGQFGVLVVTEHLGLSIDKLNPKNGITQLISKKKLTEFLLGLVKIGLAALLSYIIIKDQLPSIVQLAAGTPWDAYAAFLSLARLLFHALIGPFLILALIDFAMQKHFHQKSLMMDLEEIKQEHKELEGDPLIKGKRKQLARELAMEDGPPAKTQDANAIVVNPTHFAVAMLYDESTPVPVVLAKGRDEVALAMIERAQEFGIPVIRHVWLARTLYATAKEDMVIPKASYEGVAHVYAVIQELRETNQTDCVVELESQGLSPYGLEASEDAAAEGEIRTDGVAEVE
jgi:type III secretion protein U